MRSDGQGLRKLSFLVFSKETNLFGPGKIVKNQADFSEFFLCMAALLARFEPPGLFSMGIPQIKGIHLPLPKNS